jgi:ABC-type antimicrobial peptide transport system permease subunit
MGIFGVFAYTVSRETRQIAIRITVGATEWAVVSAVLGGGLRVVLLGFAVGMPATLAIGRLLESQLWSVGPHDAVALAAAVGLLALVALWAAYIPARRGARVDPLVALRQE